jgi:hypothetical protein
MLSVFRDMVINYSDLLQTYPIAFENDMQISLCNINPLTNRQIRVVYLLTSAVLKYQHAMSHR